MRPTLRRASSRRLAAVLMIVCIWSAPHLSQIDDVCATTGVAAHDESKHVFTSATRSDHPEHCALCHWMRSLKPDFSGGTAFGRTLEAGSAFVAPPGSCPSSTDLNHLPARAPPVRL